ncbi:MAG: DUF1848 domain-containing protein [Deltaproteobacteria bacterium]|jgi:DNA repair photolyase|nr:DUF1848 domain-containing protein [Deltaproteobacteria bacterium]
MEWKKILIQTQNGEQQAIAPLVISASRATDIPAFHAKWFMNRVRAGHCLWENPFNAKQQQYVSFEKCKAFVFWSKNPAALIPFLPEIEARGRQFYFQYTLNDYEQEGLEPRLPSLRQRLKAFAKLAERIGKHRVIWRFDPIIMSNTLTVETVLQKIQRIAEAVSPYTEKLVFSFVDWYGKSEKSLKKIDASLRPPTQEETLRLAAGIVAVNAALPASLRLATCAEDIDLAAFGIAKNHCVDAKLLLELCPDDQDMVRFYGPKKKQAGLLPMADAMKKDTGQRLACGCAPSKDIGGYDSCMHLCAYCYANQSHKGVVGKMNTLNAMSEKL